MKNKTDNRYSILHKSYKMYKWLYRNCVVQSSTNIISYSTIGSGVSEAQSWAEGYLQICIYLHDFFI